MTSVDVVRHDGHICSLSIAGHAESVPHGELDLVCAAVSVLIQALHIGLVDVLGLDVQAQTDSSQATIKIAWENVDPQADVLAETIVRSLKETAKSYPHCLKLTEVS